MNLKTRRSYESAIAGTEDLSSLDRLRGLILKEKDDADRKTLLTLVADREQEMRGDPMSRADEARASRFVWGPGDIEILDE